MFSQRLGGTRGGAGGPIHGAAAPAVRHALRSSGSPLPAPTQGFFEARFDGASRVQPARQPCVTHDLDEERSADRMAATVLRRDDLPESRAASGPAGATLAFDFSRVRVHADGASDQANRALGARAFTYGSDIFFARGEYQPDARAGRELLAHELAHVVRQQVAGAPRIQRKVSDPPKRGPDGEVLVDPQQDLFKHALREASLHPPPPRPPPAIIPGDSAQQHELLRLRTSELWDRPDVQARIRGLAADTEANEAANHPGVAPTHTAINMINHWDLRFSLSVEYILIKRSPVRTNLLNRLAQAEAQLMKSVQGDELIAQVGALRERIRTEWQVEIDRAVEGFMRLAQNESAVITRKDPPKPAAVVGLPQGLEPERKADFAPKQVESSSKPVSDSVIRFMKAVQKESRVQAKAENYSGHELGNPHVEGLPVGKFSFDVHLPFAIDPATGFYERDKTIAFFLAVERASAPGQTNIEWVALYNDAAVIKAVNDDPSVAKGRVGFQGGGGGGQYHHGPVPYILHVHFNIMPRDLATKGKFAAKVAVAKQQVEKFFESVGAHF